MHTFVSGTTVHRFKEEICPRCEALARQRQLVRYLFEAKIAELPAPVILAIGPGKADVKWFQDQGFGRLLTVDVMASAMAKMDVSRMGLRNGVFDIVVCSHVLEHVPDDISGAREILRVLKPEGLGVIQVPLRPGLAETVEYGGPNPEEFGHVRAYGQDFSSRLEKAGFVITCSEEGLFEVSRASS